MTGKNNLLLGFFIILMALETGHFISASAEESENFEEYPGSVFRYKGAKVGGPPSCMEPQGKCLAREIVDKGVTVKNKVPFPSGGMNPSAQACLYAKGTPGSITDKKGNAYSICNFQDKSFIYSWDLMQFIK